MPAGGLRGPDGSRGDVPVGGGRSALCLIDDGDSVRLNMMPMTSATVSAAMSPTVAGTPMAAAIPRGGGDHDMGLVPDTSTAGFGSLSSIVCRPVLSDVDSSSVYVAETVGSKGERCSGPTSPCMMLLGVDPSGGEDGNTSGWIGGSGGSGGSGRRGGKTPRSCFLERLGVLHGTRWVASAKNKLWWMTPAWGTRGGAVPVETQFLLVELGKEGVESAEGYYACVLPLICESTYSGMLQGGASVGRQAQRQGYVCLRCGACVCVCVLSCVRCGVLQGVCQALVQRLLSMHTSIQPSAGSSHCSSRC